MSDINNRLVRDVNIYPLRLIILNFVPKKLEGGAGALINAYQRRVLLKNVKRGRTELAEAADYERGRFFRYFQGGIRICFQYLRFFIFYNVLLYQQFLEHLIFFFSPRFRKFIVHKKRRVLIIKSFERFSFKRNVSFM